jgi:Holliday junction resolvase RusA-like endonuclease
MMVKIIVPGEPIPKPRAKGWFNKKTNILHHYYDKASGIEQFEEYVRTLVYKEFPAPVDGPVRLDVLFVFPRPKGMMYNKKAMPRESKTTRPDFDNLIKSVCDAMNGIVFRDDGQVCHGSWDKVIAAADEAPRTEITITYEMKTTEAKT